MQYKQCVPLHSMQCTARAPPFCYLCVYLLRAERLCPVVQNEAVFREGLVLHWRLVTFLSVRELAILAHGRNGPPAAVGGGDMVGRRHDGGCSCVREKGYQPGRDGEGERERERASGRRECKPCNNSARNLQQRELSILELSSISGCS